MPLYNPQSGRKIIGNVRHASGFFGNLKGLMFEQEENFDYALVFTLSDEARWGASVHMMFMNFPIGIVFLDSEKNVVDKAELRPWTLNYTPKAAAKYFIEMPAGIGKQVKIRDRLEWE